jgi:hypothetical protein
MKYERKKLPIANIAISPDVKKIELLIELSWLLLNPLSTKCLKTVPTPSNERATVNNEQNTIIEFMIF